MQGSWIVRAFHYQVPQLNCSNTSNSKGLAPMNTRFRKGRRDAAILLYLSSWLTPCTPLLQVHWSLWTIWKIWLAWLTTLWCLRSSSTDPPLTCEQHIRLLSGFYTIFEICANLPLKNLHHFFTALNVRRIIGKTNRLWKSLRTAFSKLMWRSTMSRMIW